jgi:hypothetical protein
MSNRNYGYYEDDENYLSGSSDLIKDSSEDYLEENYDEERVVSKPKRGPKKGPRKKIVYCYEFENKVVPLYDLRKVPEKIINTIIKTAISTDSIIAKEGQIPKDNLLTKYLKEFYPKDKTLQAIFKAHKSMIYYLEAELPQDMQNSLKEELVNFFKIEKEIDKLKEEYVWKCWSELEERSKGIARIIVYTKSLSHEEAENLMQDSAIFFHHLHLKFNPYFLENKKIPYIYYMLNMVRQKLRYHIQAYHIKKNKEDLKEEISDFDMTANYINANTKNENYNDWKEILARVEQNLPSDKHRLVFEMLKDGHKQKNIAKAINFTQSWISSLVKKKIKAAIIKELIETGQEDLLDSLGVDLADYKNTDFENIWND